MRMGLRSAALALLLALPGTAMAQSGVNWGAIVVGPGGAYGWAINMATEWDAEQQAFANCGGACTDGYTFYDTCAAIAVNGDYWYIGEGFMQAIAEEEALVNCEAETGFGCVINVWACTD